MRGLQGKRVIVTGGGSGIGREVCKRFAEEGSEVAVFDLNADGAAETVSLIEANGGKASAYTVDIADRAAVDSAVTAFEAGGPLGQDHCNKPLWAAAYASRGTARNG